MNDPIVRYQIIESPLSSDLEEKVEEALLRGWEPQGSIMYIESTRIFYQAMIRRLRKGE